MRLNSIPDSEGDSAGSGDVSDQLGATGRKFFLDMLAWLFHQRAESFRVDYRIAPSLTTRSECELLGLSAPRFAIRGYVTDQHSGVPHPAFFNLRRLQWLANAIEQTHGHKPVDVPKHAVVADALLGDMPWRTAGFQRLSCQLGRAYGEEATVPSGTPFMQHVDIGGGMCAQACLQMAICLQHKHASIIPSVAELTALAERGRRGRQGEIEPGEIRLKGLKSMQIVDVLCNPLIGLNGCMESAGLDAEDPDYELDGTPFLSFVLATYLESQVPVIALVRLARLAGIEGTEDEQRQSIYKTNRLPFRPQASDATSVRDHAVLLVGVRRGTADHDFLINDPAMFPFLHGTGRQLCDSRNVVQPELQFIPVLPSGVVLSLLGSTPRPGQGFLEESHPGALLWMAKSMQRPRARLRSPKTGGFGDLPLVPQDWCWPGQFRLVDWRQSEDELLVSCASLFGGHTDANRRRLTIQWIREMRQNPRHQAGRWKWMQSIGPARQLNAGDWGQLWVWDAQCRFPNPASSLLNTAYSSVEGVYDRGAGCFRRFPSL